MFRIQTRYEYWTASGKSFTKWFCPINKIFATKTEAENWVVKQTEENEKISKITKLKYETKIIETSE